MNGWIRIAALAVLVCALWAGPAAADTSNGAGAISGTVGGSVTSSTTPAPTSPTSPGSNANVQVPTTTSNPTTSGLTSSTTQTPATTDTSDTSLANLKLAAHSFGSRVLSVGSKGTDVAALQHDLTALGFAATATGVFSRQTRSQLKLFQRRYHLTTDGVAGPTSIARLKTLLSSSLHITEAPEVNGVAASSTTSTTSEPLSAADSGGVGVVPVAPTTTSTPVVDATLIDGLAIAAPGTPQVVQNVLNAANQIAFDPYIYGGGHASFNSPGYDCSGSVSFALHAGGLLATPLDSSQFMQYGQPGVGQWITIYTNGPTHAYMEIAGLWFDTAAQTASNGNDRWSITRINEPPQYYGKFVPRHPAGW